MKNGIRRMLFAGLLSTGATYSLVALAGGAWSGFGSISGIRQYGNGMIIEGLTLPDPASCGSTSSGQLYTGLDAAYIDRMERVVLAAFLSGRQIKVKVSDTLCEATLPAIYAVEVSATP